MNKKNFCCTLHEILLLEIHACTSGQCPKETLQQTTDTVKCTKARYYRIEPGKKTTYGAECTLELKVEK